VLGVWANDVGNMCVGAHNGGCVCELQVIFCSVSEGTGEGEGSVWDFGFCCKLARGNRGIQSVGGLLHVSGVLSAILSLHG